MPVVKFSTSFNYSTFGLEVKCPCVSLCFTIEIFEQVSFRGRCREFVVATRAITWIFQRPAQTGGRSATTGGNRYDRSRIELRTRRSNHRCRYGIGLAVSKRPAGIGMNTGSKQGISSPPGDTAYNVTEVLLKAYTEGLQHDLRNTEGCAVSAHLLIPGWTMTGKREHKPGASLPGQVVDFVMEALQRGDCQRQLKFPHNRQLKIPWF